MVTSCLAPVARAESTISCADLANLRIDGVEVTKAAIVPAGTTLPPPYRGAPSTGPLPAHCRLDGVIHRRKGAGGEEFGIEFALALPGKDAWNGDFMMQGGGGGMAWSPIRSAARIPGTNRRWFGDSRWPARTPDTRLRMVLSTSRLCAISRHTWILRTRQMPKLREWLWFAKIRICRRIKRMNCLSNLIFPRVKLASCCARFGFFWFWPPKSFALAATFY